jgi:alpha-L-arabinofuranosidase
MTTDKQPAWKFHNAWFRAFHPRSFRNVFMTNTRICLTILFLPVLLHAQTPAPDPNSAPPASAVISVDAASSPGPVNRLVFGQNLTAADSARIFSSNTTDLSIIETAGGFWDPAKKAPVPAILDRSREAAIAMLRYPGGSYVHNYDWHKAVGPLESRGNWKFGIDEYLSLCKTLGAEPIFTVSDYVLPADQMPANAAGLVEYLNAPATPDHPWAMKRKDWGHPDPYGVKWFELGNESAEGNMRVLPRRVYTPEQYAAYANATAAAMRAVDPTIKIGIVTMPGPGTTVECAWNRTVVQLAGKSADYLIIHLYGPEIGKNVSQAEFFQGCMASVDQDARHLDEFRALALRELGHELPLAITEYNGPCPDRGETRLSYGVALECADLLRVYLQPEHQVLGATYWQFLNGPFGMVQSKPNDSTIVEAPAFPLYALWAAHLGTRLATTQVDGARATFSGAGSVYPATGGTYAPSRSLGQLATDGQFSKGEIKPGITLDGGTGGAFTLRLDGVTGTAYPHLALFPRPVGAGALNYNVSFEARFVPDPGSAVVPLAVGVEDSRGWPVTHSAIVIDGIGTDWKSFQETYQALPDTTAVEMQGRLTFGNAKISGQIEVRGLKIEAFSAPQFPAYALLTASASLSEDGKTLHLIVFNKSADQDIPAQLHVAGFHPASASIYEVNGPGFDAKGGVTETVQGAPLDLTGAEPQHVFPAHSMTAIDFVAQANPQGP